MVITQWLWRFIHGTCRPVLATFDPVPVEVHTRNMQARFSYDPVAVEIYTRNMQARFGYILTRGFKGIYMYKEHSGHAWSHFSMRA